MIQLAWLWLRYQMAASGGVVPRALSATLAGAQNTDG